MDVRQRILKVIAEQPKLIKLAVPEWGEDVWIRRMAWPERITFKDRHGDISAVPESDQEGRVRWMVRYAIDVALDASGKKIFSKEDEDTLFRDGASTAVERVTHAALRLNSVREEDLAELGKGSAPTPNGASPSGSPATSE